MIKPETSNIVIQILKVIIFIPKNILIEKYYKNLHILYTPLLYLLRIKINFYTD